MQRCGFSSHPLQAVIFFFFVHFHFFLLCLYILVKKKSFPLYHPLFIICWLRMIVTYENRARRFPFLILTDAVGCPSTCLTWQFQLLVLCTLLSRYDAIELHKFAWQEHKWQEHNHKTAFCTCECLEGHWRAKWSWSRKLDCFWCYVSVCLDGTI